jgi:anti-sigma-K factor RskA
MKLADSELKSRLAAEYVLGTLQGAARRRFRDYLDRDAALRAEVGAWEARLTPMSEQVAGVVPPDRVWRRIDARLNGEPARGFVPAGLAFWRYLGLGASTLSAALLVLLVALPAKEPVLTSVLAEDNHVARMVIAQPKSGVLKVSMVKPWKTMDGMALQLWVIAPDGKPRPIGMVNERGETQIVLVGRENMLADGMLFAISKEPPGGSPTGQPTGPILCKGVIARMPAKASRPQT